MEKKLSKVVLLLIIILAVISVVSFLPFRPKEEQGMGEYKIIDTYYLGGKTATNTLNMIDAYVGSTTDAWVNSVEQVISVKNVDAVSGYLYLCASTTDTVLNWTNKFSMDKVGWFAETAHTDTSDVLFTHASTTATHRITPNTTTCQYLYVPNMIDNLAQINANWMSITFDTDTASGSLYAIITTKQLN